MKLIKHFIAIAIILISFNLQAQTYDTDAQAFFAVTGITDNIQKTAVNQLVVELKNAGLWANMKALYPFVGSIANTNKYNLKDPRDLDAAFRLTFNGDWSYSATGALPHGTTNDFAHTHLIPSSQLSSTNASLGVYIRNNGTNNGYQIPIGSYDGSNGYFQLNVSPILYGVNGVIGDINNYPSYTTNDAIGLTICSRTSGIAKLYLGITEKASVGVTGSLATIELFLGARNQMGYAAYASSQELAFAFINNAPLSANEVVSLNHAVDTYLSNLAGTTTVSNIPSPWVTSGNNIYYNAGNVGIGTSNPTQMLSVKGTVVATKVKVSSVTNSIDWPDYVFDKQYNLPTLEEIEKYIKQNNHLPEVPSAKDVQKNGIDLGDTQALLLKKIEELTLIVIDLNKKVEKLSKEKDLLKNKSGE